MTGCSLRPAGAAPAPGTAGGDAAHAATTTAVGRRMLFAFKTYVMCVYIYIYTHYCYIFIQALSGSPVPAESVHSNYSICVYTDLVLNSQRVSMPETEHMLQDGNKHLT